MADRKQIKITLKPPGGKIKITLPADPAPPAKPVETPPAPDAPETANSVPEATDSNVSSPAPIPPAPTQQNAESPRKIPALSLRQKPEIEKTVSPDPAQPPPGTEKKTPEQLRQDEAEIEALRKIREIEAMSQATEPSLLERYGLNRRRLFFLLFFIIVFILLLLYGLTMERGAKVVAEVKDPKGKFGKLLPQNNELFNELISDTPQAGQNNNQPPPGQQNAPPEKKVEPEPPKPPEPPQKSAEETAAEKLRDLVRKKVPEKEIASQIRELQNGFLQNEPFHLQTVAFLLGTPYHAVCRNEYLRWANENTESYLPNLISGVVLLRGRASIPYLERAIAAAPNRKQPYEKLITEYYNLGQFSRAAAVCSNALRIFPDDPDLRVRRAEIRVDNRESASEVLAELKEELSRFCPKLTGSARTVKLLAYLLHARLYPEARVLLDSLAKDPSSRSDWARYEIIYALSCNREAPVPALAYEDEATAHLKVLYYVSRRDFDSAVHVGTGNTTSVYPGFWDTFGAWYCKNEGWKVNLVRLEEKFGADPFRGTMLRLWAGRIPLARAREVLKYVPPREKGVMAFLLSLAAEREGNAIAKRVLELTCGKSLQVGIYSTLFRRYINQESKQKQELPQ